MGGGRVYLGAVMVVSASACVDADILLTLYPAREGPQSNGVKATTKTQRDESNSWRESARQFRSSGFLPLVLVFPRH